MSRGRKNTSIPPGYSLQYGYGAQPAMNAVAYVDSKGVKLNHTFEEINKLFESSGDAKIGTDRTGIASGTTVKAALDSITQAITNDRGFAGDLEYWYRNNTKHIASMEAYENDLWTAGGAAVLSQNTSLYKIGFQTQVLTESDGAAGTNYATLQFTEPLDLTTFTTPFSEASDDDYILFAFYVSDGAALDTQGVSILLSDDPTCATNRKRINITGLPDTGAYWYYSYSKKSDFIDDTGTADWSDIQSVRIAWFVKASQAGAYVAFDDIWMCRKDPTTEVPNPFQRKLNGVWTREYSISDGYWYVGDQAVAGYLGMIDLDPGITGTGSTPAALRGQTYFSDFFAEMSLLAQTTGGGVSNELCWEIDDSNRVKAYILDNELTLEIKLETLSATYTNPFICNEGDMVTISLEKHGTTITAKAKQSVDYRVSTVISEVNTTDSGVISISNNETWSMLLSLAVTTTEYAAVAGRAYIVGNTPGRDVVSKDDTTHNYYINAVDGSDTENNGLSANAAFRTIQRLYLEPFNNSMVRNNTINIYLATGEYNENITMPPVIGSGTMNWIGATAASVSIQKISAHACYLYATFQKMTVEATATAIYADRCNSMYFYDVISTSNGVGDDYGIIATYSHIHAQSCTFSNKNAAFKVKYPGSHIWVEDCTGESNNYSMYICGGAIGHILGGYPGSVLGNHEDADSLILPTVLGGGSYYATWAASAATAARAATADAVLSAVTAARATTANAAFSATYAVSAASAVWAASATTALRAATADAAFSAIYAVSAASAVWAASATTALACYSAETAYYSKYSESAAYSVSAMTAARAVTSDAAFSATYAVSAASAIWAASATTALACLSATTALQSVTALGCYSAEYAASAAYSVSATTALACLSATTSLACLSATTALQSVTSLACYSAEYAASAGTLSGLTAPTSSLNKAIYYPSGVSAIKFASYFFNGNTETGTKVTSTTGLGLSTVLGAWANINWGAAAICYQVSFNATSFTIYANWHDGSAVTALHGVYMTVYGFGYST